MKAMRIITKTVFFTALILDAAVFSLIFVLNGTVSEEYKVKKGDTFSIETAVPLTAVYDGNRNTRSPESVSVGESFRVQLRMFGVIPLSTVGVEVVDEMQVAALGQPFGMKLYTEGVLVIDITDVQTQNGNARPAAEAGIKVGDYIVSVNGRKVYTNEELSGMISESEGRKMSFDIIRDGTAHRFYITAVRADESGAYRIGLWVRDSSAGIGTLTFYSPSAGVICGLGHGICDEDTGSLLTLNSGEMVSAEIVSVTKGKSGSPGELKGKFVLGTLADIGLNAENGVYGILTGKIDLSNVVEIALKQEVENGEAQILCTVSGGKPELYSCTVKKRTANYLSGTQNLLVTVTDERLTELCGGIVQGMSGSPILQNGKLIGAITHVLVDDSMSGYGIFAENMLETAIKAASENYQGAAS